MHSSNIRVLFVVLAAAIPLVAQNITASLAGTIADRQQSAIPGANILLMAQESGAHLETKSTSNGDFTFTGLPPGIYTVAVSHSGFKTLEQNQITLTAGERRSLGTLTLDVGSLSDSVTVSGEGASVQTVSAERSGLISSSQMKDLLLIGRDYLDLLKVLPGVADFSSHEAPSGSNFNMAIQGNRPGTNNLAIDGASNLNSGSGTGTWLSPSVDAIAEVKVLLNNYQAEYGRNSGASVNVITKGGTRQFHGGAYYFKRNEVLNANNYFFNQRGQRRSRYRYDFSGFNLGGPLYIPGKFNRDRNKLFFFFAQEFLPQSFPNAQNLLTVPTPAERLGDFSNTLDQNGKLVVIKDPATGVPFPGNIIPAGRINRQTQTLLNLLPLPNYVDPTHSANLLTSDTYKQPRYESLFRVDYRFNDKHSLYFRGILDDQKQQAGYGVPAQGGNWPLIPSTYYNPTKGALLSGTNVFSPTLIHQFSAGLTRAIEQVSPLQDSDLAHVQRSKVGFTLGQFNTGVNDLDLIPNVTYGGVPNAANVGFEARYPFFGANNIWDFTDNWTKVQGTHTWKAGLFLEHVQRAAKRASTFNGAFDFSRDVNNPLDTNWAYSNALLGAFKSYSESDQRPWGNMRFWNIEWYAQDTWRVSRKLTLDYGIRFSIVQPQHERDGKAAAFVPDRFQTSKAAVLVRPSKDAAGRRVGLNPITGEVLPVTFIGSIAAGDPANGMVVSSKDSSYPAGFVENRGIQYGPRIGFAYDPAGNGKTAIRGGFGISYNREDSSIVLPFTENPPLVFTPTAFYATADSLLSAGRVKFPSSVSGIAKSGEIPTTMSFSLGVQREVAWKTIVDVGYAGTLGRHLRQGVNLNGIAPGADFLAGNQDATLPGKPLPQDILRPYPGLGNINYITYDATSNYHSLQVQANRRFTQKLQMGGAWTWSKTMSTSDGGAVSRYLNERSRYYGRAAFDRTHIVNVNWIYDLPRVGSALHNSISRAALDNWQLTGIYSFSSGAPLGVDFTTTDGADITGSPTESPRPDLIAKPEIPSGDRTVRRYFNTQAFARPGIGTLGNAAKDVLRGPGINNWDVGLYKNVLVRERVRFQLRWETYNTFNHTQFSAVDTTARFDAAGNQVNARFGQLIAARNPRRMQLALKLIF